MMKTCYAFSLALLLISQAHADIAVVVAADSPITHLNATDAARIFMKKTTNVQSVTVIPVDLPKDHPLREQFYQQALNRTGDYMLSYWTRLVFTGRGTPPPMVNSEEDLLRRLSEQPGIMGYMTAGKVDRRAKIVLRIKQ